MIGSFELIGSFQSTGTTAVYYALFNNIFSADYDDYKLILKKGKAFSGNPNNLEIRLLESDGSIRASGYDNAILNMQDNATYTESRTQTQNAIYRLPRLASNNRGIGAEIDVFNPFDSSSYTFFRSSSIYYHQTSGFAEFRKAIYVHESAESFTGVGFLVESSPNFVNIQLDVDVYGYKK